jgi:hypothetical protein
MNAYPNEQKITLDLRKRITGFPDVLVKKGSLGRSRDESFKDFRGYVVIQIDATLKFYFKSATKTVVAN